MSLIPDITPTPSERLFAEVVREERAAYYASDERVGSPGPIRPRVERRTGITGEAYDQAMRVANALAAEEWKLARIHS